MKYSIREIEDPKGYIDLEISFEVDLYIVDKEDKDVKFVLTPEERDIILNWFREKNEDTVKAYSLSEYTVEFKEDSDNKLIMSFIIENPSIHLKSMTISHIIHYLSEDMSFERTYINLRNKEVFPKGICNFD